MNNSILEGCFIVGAASTLYLLYLLHQPRKRRMQLQEAVITVMKAGYNLERGGFHLYKNGHDKFAVLAFGKGSHIEIDQEFTDPAEAVGRHADLAGPAELAVRSKTPTSSDEDEINRNAA